MDTNTYTHKLKSNLNFQRLCATKFYTTIYINYSMLKIGYIIQTEATLPNKRYGAIETIQT